MHPNKKQGQYSFLISKIYFSYGKIKIYARPKITNTEPRGGGWLNRGLKFLFVFFGLISFSNLIFSENSFALYAPTLSVSVDNSAVSINGNQVINSTNKTTEIPFNFTVNTNNRTGYTATLSAETENTALTNTGSAVGAKIDSISTNLTLNNLPNNTWGYKFGTSSGYAPIPALSTPAQIVQTAGKTNGNELNQLSIGMKLADNLESGNYTNKLILSFVSNTYTMRAVMTSGPDFNTRVGNLDPNPAYYSGPDSSLTKPSIKAFKRSTVAPAGSVSAINIEDPDASDYEIKAWYNAADQAVYYYAEPNTVFLNENSKGMFQWFTKMETIDLTGFDTREVTSMNTMFYMMNSLKNIDVSGFNTSKVTDMCYMFFSLPRVRELDLTNFDTRNVTNMYGMFDDMTDVTKIKFSDKFDTSNVINMGRMFSRMKSIQQLDLSHFNTGNVIDMAAMFLNSSALTSLDLSSFDTRNVEFMNLMFQGVAGVSRLRLNNFNTEKVKDMNAMFAYMSELEDLDVSSFDTRRVTNMYGMFSGVKKLRNLNVSSFNTNAVTNMGYMFTNMAALENLNINNFNTSAVTNMNNMFSGMANLRSLNLSNFDTRNVKDMGGMFHNMKTITELNLSNFNTSNVLSMEVMFYNMTALKTLDISNFDTSQVGSVKSIFATADGDNLERIYVNNDLNTTRLTSYMDYMNMFMGRNKLRGGNGSYLSDPASAGLTWLRVDRPGVQGYFTRKS